MYLPPVRSYEAHVSPRRRDLSAGGTGVTAFSDTQAASGGGNSSTLRVSKSHVSRVKRSGYHGSADSLLVGQGHESVRDVEGCFKNQCSQVFIGMISMQYQAKLVSARTSW